MSVIGGAIRPACGQSAMPAPGNAFRDDRDLANLPARTGDVAERHRHATTAADYGNAQSSASWRERAASSASRRVWASAVASGEAFASECFTSASTDSA